jgi:hypothetical protein
VKITRESARAKKQLHRNITPLHEGRLLRSKLTRIDDSTVAYSFEHSASEHYSSKFTIEFKRDDLLRLLETMEG